MTLLACGAMALPPASRSAEGHPLAVVLAAVLDRLEAELDHQDHGDRSDLRGQTTREAGPEIEED